MTIAAGLLGLLLLGIAVRDAFELVLLPRRASGLFRPSRLVLRPLWRLFRALGGRIEKRNRRENVLSAYPHLGLILVLAMWAAVMIVGFALLYWANGSRLATESGGRIGFWTDLYLSGTTFFTLGLGDVVPATAAGRLISVVEAGTGFGFLALVLAYVPVLYQSFSSRETRITLLDAWAGSPPSAAVILRRSFESADPGAALDQLFRDWEVEGAEILESHLSYPILAFFRSQHDNQSWLASLTAILDSCALVIVGVDRVESYQARLTFAIGRHTLVDITQNFGRTPLGLDAGPEPTERIEAVRAWLAPVGVTLARGEEADRKLAELRLLYLPYAEALSRYLLMPLPSLMPPETTRYNWETTAWARTAQDDAH